MVNIHRYSNFVLNIPPFNTPAFHYENVSTAIIQFKVSLGNQSRELNTFYPDIEFKDLISVMIRLAQGESLNEVIEFFDEIKTHVIRLETKGNGKVRVVISYSPYLSAIYEFMGLTRKLRIVLRQETTVDLLIRAFIRATDIMLVELNQLDADSYPFKRSFPRRKYKLLKEIMEMKMMQT